MRDLFSGASYVYILLAKENQRFSMNFFHDFISGVVCGNLNKNSIHSLSPFFQKTF
jgi:hypothetical protein